MTDDDDDRPDHVGTGPDETPFDHGCECPVCHDYRAEVKRALASGDYLSLSDRQFVDYLELKEQPRETQTALSSF